MNNQTCCLKSRTIFLVGTIGEELCLSLYRDVSNILADDSKGPIRIILSTDGGCVYSCMAMYDFLQSLPVVVTIVGSGYVFSAGIILLQSADKKESYLHTRYMLHEPSTQIDGKVSHLKTDLKEIVEMENMYKNICGVSNFPKFDKYYSAEQMLELGLIDTVLK